MRWVVSRIQCIVRMKPFTPTKLTTNLLRPMRRLLTLLFATTVCLSPVGTRGASADKLSRADVANIMQGDYIVVGKKPDSRATYTGRLTFRARGQTLAFRRTVDGHTVRGVATLEVTVVGDPAPVLRMNFVQDGQRYGATLQWMFDLDNYARFTGYVYRSGNTTKVVGLEMLFPLPPTIRD